MPDDHAGGGPERACVGCRRRAHKGALVRVVRSPDGAVALDDDQSAPGRGAYLCPERDCWLRARRRGALGRALRVEPGRIDGEALERDLRKVWQRSGFTS